MNKRFLLIAFVLLALATSAVAQTVTADRFRFTTGPCVVRSGSGDPDGVVVGNVCDVWLRSDTGVLYLKTTGTDHHGWTISGGVTGTGTGGYLTGWTGTSTLGATGLTYTTSEITGGTWNAGAVTSSGVIVGTQIQSSATDAGRMYWTKTDAPAQTWAITGNSTGFYVYDVTAGYVLPVWFAAVTGNATFTGTMIGGPTAEGTGANTLPTLRLRGYNMVSSGSDAYGAYGGLLLNSSAAYTSTARRWLITNALGANKFAIIYGTSATADPTLGTAGALTAGTTALTIDNAGTVSSGGTVMPLTKYAYDLGSLQTKWRSIHAAELWVETLVAQNTIATIGGRVLVAPTTTLVADLTAIATTIHVKHNQMANGDRVYLEADSKVEFMSIDSAAGGSAGDYTYTVTRNLDGSGANVWYAGDAMLNTGTTGDGFIDLYSVSGVLSGAGPTIVGNVRTGTTYNNIAPRWAAGNLYNLYDYGAADVYGFAAGNYSTTWVSVDATNGFRVNYGGAERVHIDASGNAAFTGTVTASAGAIGGFTIGSTELYAGTGATRVQMTSNGGFHAGATAFADAPFSVTVAGVLKSTSGTIGGFTLAANTLSSGTDADYVAMSSAGTNAFWAGDSTFADAEFSVTAAGVVKATSASITGTVNATAGYFGSGSTKVAINSDGLDVGSAGRILGGMTAYNTGTGFWLGYSGAYKLSIGHDDGNRVTWDGTDLTVVSGTVSIGSAGITLSTYTTASLNANYAFRWVDGSYAPGLYYWSASGAQVLTLNASTNASGTRIEFVSGSYTLIMAGNALTPSQNGNFDLGNATEKLRRVYADTYYGGTSAGHTDTLNCGADGIQIAFVGGIVISGSCTSPAVGAVSTTARLLSLEQRIADLETILAIRRQQ